MKKENTYRGFEIITFIDSYDAECSLQESSSAEESRIWLGINDADPKIMAKDTTEGGVGWVHFHVPKNVSMNTRMHLNRKQVKSLLPHLVKFAFTGRF